MQQSDTQPTGIINQPAPDLGVTQWINAAGEPIQGYGLDQMPGFYKVIFCYQDACPGCHITGFPALVKLVKAFQGSPLVSVAAVQTVFEDFEANSFDRLAANQLKYALPVPFGHDAGQGREGAGSVLMQRYRNGGTPWFIVIDPEGTVIYNHFSIDVEKLIAQLKRPAPGVPRQAPDANTLTWRGVMALTREGNPSPPRRLELDAAQWRERLTAEQFRVTRQKGTERAHSSAMCSLFEPGRYSCVCCGTELFDASSKFASKSGWPSFTQALAPGLVAYHDDSSHGMTRVETTCNVCDAHLGHVFSDGPDPSGLRYCMNAVALVKA